MKAKQLANGAENAPNCKSCSTAGCEISGDDVDVEDYNDTVYSIFTFTVPAGSAHALMVPFVCSRSRRRMMAVAVLINAHAQKKFVDVLAWYARGTRSRQPMNVISSMLSMHPGMTIILECTSMTSFLWYSQTVPSTATLCTARSFLTTGHLQKNCRVFFFKTRATVEVHDSFSYYYTPFGSLRPLPKTDFDLEKNKTAIKPDAKSHGLARHTTRIMQKNGPFFPDDFGAKEPRHSENSSDEK